MSLDIEVVYSGEHSTAPIMANCADDMVDAVDDVLFRQERWYNYIFVSVTNRAGEFVARLGIGVLLDGSGGFIDYGAGSGNFLTRGTVDSDSPVEFFGWGYSVYCPECSVVDLRSLKSALRALYGGGFSSAPDAVDWQNWFDCSPPEKDADYPEAGSGAELDDW